MSRRKTREQEEAEAWAADQAASELAHKQAECSHWECRPTEWHWSGKPREMTCENCGATNYLEE